VPSDATVWLSLDRHPDVVAVEEFCCNHHWNLKREIAVAAVRATRITDAPERSYATIAADVAGNVERPVHATQRKREPEANTPSSGQKVPVWWSGRGELSFTAEAGSVRPDADHRLAEQGFEFPQHQCGWAGRRNMRHEI